MKAGNFFIIGFEGTKLTADLEKKLKKLKPAGVILYDTNVDSKEQVQKLISDLKKLLGKDLIVSVDQEGGRVQRLRKICNNLPSLKATGIASHNSKIDYASSHGKLLAKDLKALGFNLVFAPCLDVNSNAMNPIIGTRSFSSDADIVSKLGSKMLTAIQKSGVMPCIKHFPGHGGSSEDSHQGPALVKMQKAEYLKHRSCFEEAIDAGAKACMVSHILLDIENYYLSSSPVSLDMFFLNTELSMAFQGVVFSDEITMRALSEYGNYSELAKKMLDSGINYIVWNTNIDDALEVAQSLEDFDFSVTLEQNQNFQKEVSSLKTTAKAIDGLEERMAEIAQKAIEINKEIKLEKGNYAIVISDHDKLEAGLVKEVFEAKVFKLSEYDKDKLEKFSQVLVLGFNLWHKATDLLKLEEIKKNHYTFYVECEQATASSDINLNGCSKIHLEALKSSLG